MVSRVLFIVVGIGALLIAGVIAFNVRDFIRTAAVADGVVVDAERFGGSHPDIEFPLASGQKVRYTQGGWIFGYKAGQKVRVLYRPSNPAASACVDAFGALWFAALLMLAIGLFFVVVNVFARSK